MKINCENKFYNYLFKAACIDSKYFFPVQNVNFVFLLHDFQKFLLLYIKEYPIRKFGAPILSILNYYSIQKILTVQKYELQGHMIDYGRFFEKILN